MILKLFTTDNEFDGTFYRDVCSSKSLIEKGLSQIESQGNEVNAQFNWKRSNMHYAK